MALKQRELEDPKDQAPSPSLLEADDEDEEELIQISDDVITHIVELAGREIAGVSLIESKSSFSELRNFISKGKFINRKQGEEPRRISVERGAKKGDVKIQVSVEMEYGKDMYELAVRLRNHIKDAVEKMTRVTVKKVDVAIVGIRLSEDHKKNDQELLSE